MVYYNRIMYIKKINYLRVITKMIEKQDIRKKESYSFIYIKVQKQYEIYKQLKLAITSLYNIHQIEFKSDRQKIVYLKLIEYIRRVEGKSSMNSIEEKIYYDKLIDKIDSIENSTGLAIIE